MGNSAKGFMVLVMMVMVRDDGRKEEEMEKKIKSHKAQEKILDYIEIATASHGRHHPSCFTGEKPKALLHS